MVEMDSQRSVRGEDPETHLRCYLKPHLSIRFISHYISSLSGCSNQNGMAPSPCCFTSKIAHCYAVWISSIFGSSIDMDPSKGSLGGSTCKSWLALWSSIYNVGIWYRWCASTCAAKSPTTNNDGVAKSTSFFGRLFICTCEVRPLAAYQKRIISRQHICMFNLHYFSKCQPLLDNYNTGATCICFTMVYAPFGKDRCSCI